MGNEKTAEVKVNGEGNQYCEWLDVEHDTFRITADSLHRHLELEILPAGEEGAVVYFHGEQVREIVRHAQAWLETGHLAGEVPREQT